MYSLGLVPIDILPKHSNYKNEAFMRNDLKTTILSMQLASFLGYFKIVPESEMKTQVLFYRKP